MKHGNFILLMIEAGFKPKGLNTEQHDMLFAIGQAGEWGEPINDPAVHVSIKAHFARFLKNGEKVHIDGWAQVTQVSGYSILPQPISAEFRKEHNLDLFFANLGGYKINTQREKHKAILVLAENLEDVKAIAKKDSFRLEVDEIKGAGFHVDEEGQLSGVKNMVMDDVGKVMDMFPDFDFIITPNAGTPDSWTTWNVTGYKVI